MKARSVSPTHALSRAREELRRGNAAVALEWAKLAAKLAPEREEPWLVLAAAADPEAGLRYARRALQINPASPRAKRAVAWAESRQHSATAAKMQSPAARPSPRRRTPERRRSSPGKTQSSAALDQPQVVQAFRDASDLGRLAAPSIAAPRAAVARRTAARRGGRLAAIGLVLVLIGCLVLTAAAWTAVNTPVMASILSMSGLGPPAPTHVPSFARAAIPKPTYTPAAQAQAIATETPPFEPEVVITPTATSEPPTEAFEPTVTPGPTDTPGVMYAEIVPDTPTSEYVAPTAAPYKPPSPGSSSAAGNGEHWIDVDLSQQRVYAYDGDTLVNAFVVSTGTWQTPTVTGSYKIWIKLRSTTMTGPGYSLPNVPYVMYFYKGYGLHGTYWHNNFGVPMSHGCVNLTIPDAAWLYDFASVGTVVNVHY